MAIEEGFQTAEELTGLDEHQVRRWTSWRRWTPLAMLAHALLAVISADEHDTDRPTTGLIALICNEIRHLLLRLAAAPIRIMDAARIHAWSRWRRRRPHQARTSHYQRQRAAENT